MVGSSWNAADSSGEAPTMSPAATVTLLRWPARAWRRWVARYSTPPASTFTSVTLPPTSAWSVTMRPLEPDGASRFPWKSLNDRIWTSRVLSRGWAFEIPLVVATPVPVARTTARTPVRRRVRAVLMGLPAHGRTRGIGRFARAGAGYGLAPTRGRPLRHPAPTP